MGVRKKWDGFRAIAVAKPGQATLYSRNLNVISRKYPSISAALAKIKHEAVLDSELVALDEHGRSRFQLLPNAEREPARLLYCVFDLLISTAGFFARKAGTQSLITAQFLT